MRGRLRYLSVLSIGLLLGLSLVKDERLVHRWSATLFLYSSSENEMKALDSTLNFKSNESTTAVTRIPMSSNLAQKDLTTLKEQDNVSLAVSHHSSQDEMSSLPNGTRESVPPVLPMVTLKIMMVGRMANFLGYIAFAVLLQHKARNEIGVELKIVPTVPPSWYRAVPLIQKCFPSLRDLQFNRQKLYQIKNDKKGALVDIQLDSIAKDLGALKERLQEWVASRNTKVSNNATAHNQPYAYASGMVYPVFPITDTYIREILDALKLDEDACCALKPDADETVFHLRGFFAEARPGPDFANFEELSVNKTVRELFGSLRSSDKLAIVTGVPHTDARLREYMSAFWARNVSVRLVSQDPMQDFCFLCHAQKELVGHLVSTFTAWAAALNKVANKIRLYTVDSPHMRRTGGIFAAHRFDPQSRQWELSDPRSKIVFELYKTEALEDDLARSAGHANSRITNGQ